jgi:hypothetical protein
MEMSGGVLKPVDPDSKPRVVMPGLPFTAS